MIPPLQKTVKVKNKNNSKMCDECNLNAGRMSKYFSKNLCSDCNQKDEYKLICKTAAKAEFFLTDRDISNLEYFSTKNPHYPSKTMTLFKQNLMRRVFMNKYNCSEDKIEEMKKELKEYKDKKREKRQQNKLVKEDKKIEDKKQKLLISDKTKFILGSCPVCLNEKIKVSHLICGHYICVQCWNTIANGRQDEIAKCPYCRKEILIGKMSKDERLSLLTSKLKIYELKLRGDSKLCQNFLDDTLDNDWDIDSVVERMCQMRFLFEYQNMKNLMNDEYSKRMKEKEKFGWYDGEESVFNTVEENILEKIGDYPSTWPWMQNAVTLNTPKL